MQIKQEIEMGFMEGGSFKGVQEINSVLPLSSYELQLSDGIVFTSIPLEKALRSKGIVVFDMPNGWQHKHHIPATEFMVFFDILNQLIATQKYEVRRNVLKNLLDTLCEKNYLTSLQKAQYLETIPSSYGYLDMKADVLQHKDADLVLKMVAYLFEQKEYSSAVDWLSVAKVYNPDHDFFKNSANIQALLLRITGDLFINPLFRHKKHAWLLDQIVSCPAIISLNFGTQFNPDCINDRFAEFLTKAHFVKILDLHATWSADMRMGPRHVTWLAKGLACNTSVQQIELQSQSIEDAGLIMIIEALKANPYNKLKSLNVASNCITAVGAEALLEYMHLNNALVEVNLGGNRQVPPELVKAVHAMANKDSPLQHSLLSGFVGFEKGERGISLFFSSPDSSKLEKLKVETFSNFMTIEKKLAERRGNRFFYLEYKNKPLEPMSTPEDYGMHDEEIIVVHNSVNK